MEQEGEAVDRRPNETKKVFIIWKKTVIEEIRRISLRREFHGFGAMSEKALPLVATNVASGGGGNQSRTSKDDCVVR